MIIRILAALLALFISAPMMASAESISAIIASSGETALKTGVAPGIAIAVVRNGTIIAAQGFGYANITTKRAVTPDTRFAIGSLTKQFTAAAIMLLVNDGKLRLDDTLAAYFPALPNAKTITLQMLLNQTSGLHTYPLLSEHPWPLKGSIATSTILSYLASDHPDFLPGTKWAYSNANYAVLAAIIEKASGESYGTFLQRHIFRPLGMAKSGYGFLAQTSAPIAVGYEKGQAESPALSLDLLSGAGGIVSSVNDLARWDSALMGNTLLTKADRHAMWAAGELPDGAKIPYAMGWIPTQIAGHREVWHNGLAPGVGGYCYNAIFPDDNVAIVVLTNGFAAGGIPERIVANVAASLGIGQLPSDTKPQSAPGDDPNIDALAQKFWSQLASNTVDSSLLEAKFADALTPSLRSETAQGITIMGPVKSWTFVGKSRLGEGLLAYRYHLIFVSGQTHDWAIVIDHAGKIAGSRLVQ